MDKELKAKLKRLETGLRKWTPEQRAALRPSERVLLLAVEEAFREYRRSRCFSDRFLWLMPLKYLEREYEAAKCDAKASRLERFEKDGNEVAANRNYHREMRKVVFFFTFLTLPVFLMGEMLAQVRRKVAR